MSRASSRPAMMRTWMPVAALAALQKATPLSASRTAEVAAACTSSTPSRTGRALASIRFSSGERSRSSRLIWSVVPVTVSA